MPEPVVQTAMQAGRSIRPGTWPAMDRIIRPLGRFRASVLMPAVMTGAMLWLCYFPVSCGWLAWVALVPLLTLIRRDTTKRDMFFGTWAAGLLFYLAAIQWMRAADPRMYFTWIGLSLYCSLYFPLSFGLARSIDRRTRLPLVITLPVVWTALEFLRAHFGTGFPWYFLAHSQHDFAPVIQIADLTGAYGVTFLVVACNVLVFEWLSRWQRFRQFFSLPEMERSRRALLLQTAATGLALAGVLGYGGWRLSQDDFPIGPKVALVQSNLPQEVRNAAAIDYFNNLMLEHNTRLTDRAMRMYPDLIVWPETSNPNFWSVIADNVDPDAVATADQLTVADSRNQIRKLSRRWPTNVLYGMNSEVYTGGNKSKLHNSAVLIGADGKPAARYDKMHRVPFGEYVPLRDWLPLMNWFAPYDYDYSISSGEQFTRFPAGAYRFGVVICFEDSDPTLARQYACADAAEPPADFLVNISNDGWFKGTSEHEEHLAICRFRAVECRRAVLRAVNMGVSAVIDGNGRVLAPVVFAQDGEMTFWGIPDRRKSLAVSEWAKFKGVPGVLAAVVPLDSRQSLYAQWGDWLPWTCWSLLAVGLVLARFRRVSV